MKNYLLAFPCLALLVLLSGCYIVDDGYYVEGSSTEYIVVDDGPRHHRPHNPPPRPKHYAPPKPKHHAPAKPKHYAPPKKNNHFTPSKNNRPAKVQHKNNAPKPKKTSNFDRPKRK